MFDPIPQRPGKENAPSPAPGCLRVPLKKFTPHWPRFIRNELAVLPAEATLAIPLDELGEALRHGKVKFPWTRLRAWINPPLEPAADSGKELHLELPIPVVAPLFTALSGND